MPVSWKWRLVVALVGMALFLSYSWVAIAKIERSTDKEGTLHISNTGEVPVKPGGVPTPNPPSAPPPQPSAPPQPLPPASRPVPVPPPPPVEPGEAPPVMEPEPNEQQVEPPAEQQTSETGNDGAGHRVQAKPDAGSDQPGVPRPSVPGFRGQGGRGRGVPVR